MERPLYRQIWDELAAHKAMVFLAGPRQVGKTTLVRQVAAAGRFDRGEAGAVLRRYRAP
jgi:predicted AAA+ superfamily ATPase